jgi:hypothetical protein
MVSMEILRIFKETGLLTTREHFQATSCKDLRITNNDHADDADIGTLHVSISFIHIRDSLKNFHRIPSMK